MKKPGIHIRLLLAAFALICAATFSLGAVGISITREFMESRFKDRMFFLAKYLALNAEVGVLIDDRSALERLASNLLSEEDVATVTILDNHGNKLVNISSGVSSSLRIVETPVISRRLRDVNLLFSLDTGVKISETESIGKVRITYSTRGIDQLMALIGRRFIFFSAGLTCLAGLIFYFISRSIVVQVTRLAQAAHRVAGGDLELRAQPGTLPETRKLALAFNAMLDSLAASRNALEEANKRIMRQKMLAEMGKFSLMIAHEVKNPLSIIKCSVDVLKKDQSLPTRSTMIGYIEDEIKRLNRLIEDFLSFARPSLPSFRVVDLNAMLKEVVTRFELQKAGTSIEIQAEISSVPCQAQADPDLLIRALSNIIKNACEANGEKGLVRITACCRQNTWIVEVEDEGKGIAPENLKKIFEPFFTTRTKGTGLGLAFAFQAINNHGGVITAKNRAEGGARFKVELKIED